MTTKTLTIQDPREFDGDPYQVAERAIQQLRGLVTAAQEALPATVIIARNADLQRQLDYGNDIGEQGRKWPQSPQGRLLTGVETDLSEVQAALKTLERAVAFNPKAR